MQYAHDKHLKDTFFRFKTVVHTSVIGGKQKRLEPKMTKMNKINKKSSGLLVCGACAIPANTSARETASVEMLAHTIKSIFAQK